MHMAERMSTAVYAMLLSVTVANSTSYAKNPAPTDTFEPGRKHTCVPDNQGWRCVLADHSSGQSVAEGSSDPTKTTAASDTNAASATATKNDTPISAGELPSYLTNPNARNDAQYGAPRPESAKSASAANPSLSHDLKPGNIQTKPTAANSRSSVPIKKSPAEAGSASTRPADIAADTEAIPNGLHDNNDFLALPGNRYVVELAHGTDRDGITQLANAVGIPAGQLYRLHFTHNKTNAWMLVWASYESINAARSAFANLPHHGLLNAGWSRRIAPLQAELRSN